MKMMRFAVLAAGMALVGACEDPLGEDAILAPIPPLAYTRFVNGVSDTGATDWRFVDALEYSPVELGRTFRTFSPYAGTAPGSRRLKIFPTTTDIALTQVHFIDSTFTLTAGSYYTIIHTGFSRTGSTPADQLVIIEDAIPASVATTNFATRFVHMGTGLGAQDAHAVATAATTIVGNTPMFAGVAYGTASAYDATRATGTMAFRAANAGQTVTVTASTLAPPGDTAQVINNLTAIGGYNIGRSVFTGFLFPASVTCTNGTRPNNLTCANQAPTAAAFTSPAITFLVDRHPR